MENQRHLYKNSSISYYSFGTGARVVVCFHGYGEDATSFDFLGKYGGSQYSFISIDLPFHGHTEWKEELSFTINDLQQIVKEIPELKNRKLILLGFSLGSRVALCLYQAMPKQIDKIVLLAPDGLKVNFWYWLSTQTWIGKKLFAFTMNHPGWFFGILKIFNKLGLVNVSIYKFINYYIGDKDARLSLYHRWIALRKMKPVISLIKSFITEYKTTVRLLYGKHDRIILSVRGEKFKKGIEEQCRLTVIHTGHQVLHEKHAKEIIDALDN
ncbi:MAG: alpha/beta hydrolase [Bacteroidia bacterium]|nr:alpha/beta hydrolase [Bacteroidia bacterium]